MRLELASMTFAIACALGASQVAQAQMIVTQNVTTNTTWSGEVILDTAIFVKNGATLTILPNTIVRSQPRTGPVLQGQTAGTPGALIVTANGQIVANATATSSIIFTTAVVDNDGNGVADDLDGNGFLDKFPGFDPAQLPALVPDATPTFLDSMPRTAPLAPLNAMGAANVSLWGGLVILGGAPVNLAGEGPCGVYGQGSVEGLTVPGFPVQDTCYGGQDVHDSSGSLNFVSVRHGGDEIGEGNELNGITLAGVGDGTRFSNIEVYCNFDDGIEWFGGTVSGQNLSVTFAGDDSFDVDQGYSGVNQFLLAIMPFFDENDANGGNFGSASGDKAGEFDGDDFAEGLVPNVNIQASAGNVQPMAAAPQPLSSAQFYNFTVIGSTPDPGSDFAGPFTAANRGVQMRNGFSGQLINAIVVNTGIRQGFEVINGDGGTPGFDAVDNVNAGRIAVISSTFQNTTAPLNPSAEQTAIANGNALAPLFGGQPNRINPAPGALGFNGLLNEDTTFDPRGVMGKLNASLKTAPIDYRPGSGLQGAAGGVRPFSFGTNPNAVTRGATAPTAVTLFTTGWTALNQAGLLAN